MPSIDYPWLYDTVRKRFDSDAALEDFLPKALSADELRRKGDDRYLSAMSQRVFQAGMQHTMVDAKWPAFEEVFKGFPPEAMVAIGPAEIDGWLKDARIIRHRTKLESIPKNARFILDIRAEHGGSFGDFIADWPVSDIVGLWRVLAQRGSRLGGRSASGFLRLVGKDTFLITSHVIARLQESGVIECTPTSQRDLQRVQEAFNALQETSGRPLCQLSALLALSIHPMFEGGPVGRTSSRQADAKPVTLRVSVPCGSGRPAGGALTAETAAKSSEIGRRTVALAETAVFCSSFRKHRFLQ